MDLCRTGPEILTPLSRKSTWSSSCFHLLKFKSPNFLASLGKLNDLPPLQRKLMGFVHSDFTSSLKHQHSQSRLKDISIATYSSFSQINQEVGISDKCHLLIFQRDKFWWCDQQVPRLFLACSTKIVTMATLRGQTSKEMHCEHRNSRALSSKKEGGSVGRFPMRGAGASLHTPRQDPKFLCSWYSQALSYPGAHAPRKREKMWICGAWQAEQATPWFFAGTKVAWEWDKSFGGRTKEVGPWGGRQETWVLITNQVTLGCWPPFQVTASHLWNGGGELTLPHHGGNWGYITLVEAFGKMLSGQRRAKRA